MRLLAVIEAGQANLTLGSLEELAGAFGVDAASLLHREVGQRSVALVGLRGAGKSTIGLQLATAIGWPFVELDRAIERESGLSLSALFELHGEPHVRALERPWKAERHLPEALESYRHLSWPEGPRPGRRSRRR